MKSIENIDEINRTLGQENTLKPSQIYQKDREVQFNFSSVPGGGIDLHGARNVSNVSSRGLDRVFGTIEQHVLHSLEQRDPPQNSFVITLHGSPFSGGDVLSEHIKKNFPAANQQSVQLVKINKSEDILEIQEKISQANAENEQTILLLQSDRVPLEDIKHSISVDLSLYTLATSATVIQRGLSGTSGNFADAIEASLSADTIDLKQISENYDMVISSDNDWFEMIVDQFGDQQMLHTSHHVDVFRYEDIFEGTELERVFTILNNNQPLTIIHSPRGSNIEKFLDAQNQLLRLFIENPNQYVCILFKNTSFTGENSYVLAIDKVNRILVEDVLLSISTGNLVNYQCEFVFNWKESEEHIKIVSNSLREDLIGYGYMRGFYQNLNVLMRKMFAGRKLMLFTPNKALKMFGYSLTGKSFDQNKFSSGYEIVSGIIQEWQGDELMGRSESLVFASSALMKDEPTFSVKSIIGNTKLQSKFIELNAGKPLTIIEFVGEPDDYSQKL
ncbi:MAG: hypothetical protein KC713_10580, partial [Candidatus Omnitrophica bacterium]|nr:hypothetical protein [Candidatus Omnitrophota bacterium]